MSFSTSTTVYGQIIIEDKIYDLLSQPLGDEQKKTIDDFKKEHNCGISSAPWSVNKYKWILEDNKLYLIEVIFKLCEDKSNVIEKVFSTKELEAIWLSSELQVLIEDYKDYSNPDKPRERKRKLMILDFNDGILISSREIEEIYTTNRLLDYLES
ncbi:MAG: hypothetical protein IE890_10630 [Arcobacter sp.]|nr:hypothetical protein [Arcobacter sp.]